MSTHRAAVQTLASLLPLAIAGLALAGCGADTAAVDDASNRPPPALEPRLTSSAWLSLLPDGETKRRFVLDCAGCHQFDDRIVHVAGAPRDRASWTERTEQMLSFSGASSGFPVMAPSRDAEGTADWLVTNLEGVEPTPAAPVSVPEGYTVTEFPLPRSDLPHDVAVDPQGRVVATGQLTGVMYVLDPATGVFSQESIPEPGPRAVEIDGDGTWTVVLGDPEAIGQRPTGSEWQVWPVGMYPHEATIDGRGRIWFNGHFTKAPELLGYVDPATGEVRTFEVPVPPMPDDGSTIPYGLRAAPDGTIWMTELVGGRLVRFDPETETFDLYPLPTPYSGPRRLDIAPDGTVWIPEFSNNRLARFDPESETFTEYELPVPDALPYVARVAPDGSVWVGTAGADLVARFDPAKETFTLIPLPTTGSLVRHLDIDERSGEVWGVTGDFPPRSPRVFRIRGPQSTEASRNSAVTTARP
ncbi:MAG: virginiamycin B lyase family protein [Gemmatimonadota bacterium]